MSHYNPNNQRRSIRLKDYGYTQAGAYFVTVCTWERECLFGAVMDGAMCLNPYGRIVENEWLRTPTVRPQVELDAFVIMPNHMHAVVVFTTPTAVRTHSRGPLPALHRDPRSLGALIAGFKSTVTKQINVTRSTPGIPVWHRNYYEHVIRNERTLDAIRQYISDNPARWHLDRFNAAAVERDPQALALWNMLKNDDTGIGTSK